MKRNKLKLLIPFFIIAVVLTASISGCDRSEGAKIDNFENTAPVVITDDTPLPYEQLATEENMQRMCDDTNAYFQSLGMIYDDNLDPNWYLWLSGHQGNLDNEGIISYNEMSQNNIDKLKRQVDMVIIEHYGATYDTVRFNTIYELTDSGFYNIIFCYYGL